MKPVYEIFVPMTGPEFAEMLTRVFRPDLYQTLIGATKRFLSDEKEAEKLAEFTKLVESEDSSIEPVQEWVCDWLVLRRARKIQERRNP